MEQIFITGLKIDTLIGVYDWERTRRTELEVDLTLEADLSKAMTSDDVADTIDYAAVAGHVQAIAAQSSFELLEALGKAILDAVLTAFPVKGATLRIIKPGILPDAKQVGIQMSRARY
ncbi:dihydroneopterin aldolase [Alteromonas aestuariivivens]|uniref:7,8-dihydroneopterin aldolase n=1 Tax=Alteromonas aestuariivivens TaxID=1938339 RepID=A0A3D8MCB2_9ALTE|nr:dihydroneopterin aldolase [Alteromonas aestuariivivens]RDV28052.1 dihydroneopterin aldolase [Alteromonas aestuariivivens]